jgi:general secretion pathway protein D
MNKTTPNGRFRGLANLLLVGFVSIAALNGCSGVLETVTPVGVTTSKSAEIEMMLSRMVPRNDLQKTIKEGLVKLSHGDYLAAGTLFQAGLRLEPANGHLHFLNALSYHLRGVAGDSKMLDLAQAGYVTALNFDESNHMAAYLLGQIYFRKREYLAAQNYFAYGLFYAPDNTHLLNALAAASYYSRDPATAEWASRKAYHLAPGSPASIRNVMFAEAATGQFEDTPRLMRDYEAASRGKIEGGDAYWVDMKLEQTSGRLNDWKKFHVAANDAIFSTPSSDIVTYSGDEDKGGTEGAGPFAKEEASPDTPSAAPASAFADTAGKGKPLPKMTHIDVVIIRTEEIRSQSKGINLLEGLQTTLGGTLFGYNYDKTTGSSASRTIQKTINPVFTLKDLEYNLNIFNDESNKAEILARPSLLATENVTSQFFSGGVLHVQLSSSNYDGGLEDINIGITLSVTPEFLDADTLGVSVQADHEFLEMQSENVGFTAFAQTTKTTVQAKAILKFGETLILSGLSERGKEDSKSGVPILQDIPGVQYLFSKKEEMETKKSILILLTPRKPRYANDTLTEAELDNHMDLEKIYTDKLKTAEKIHNTNLNAAIAHLNNDSQFYRQFRTGDIELNFFEDDDSIFGAIKRTLGFLYY